MAHKSKHGIVWNLPDTEETQHMVDTDSIEVLFHPAHPAMEPFDQRRPFAISFYTFTPPICGEAPVLAIGREIIGRSTGGCVETEEIRMGGRLHTIAIDPDGDITLQTDSILTGIVGGSLQLKMKVILDEIYRGER